MQIKQEKSDKPKCSICWNEPPINAIKLNCCQHVYCFLCIKSAITNANKCPLCRLDIKENFDFDVLDVIGEIRLPAPGGQGRDKYWFYEGKTGWWLYDADTTRELEDAYLNDVKKIEKVIAGQVYVINLSKFKQHQKNDSIKSRKVDRASWGSKEPILGVAGLRDPKILEALERKHQSQQHQSQQGSASSLGSHRVKFEDELRF